MSGVGVSGGVGRDGAERNGADRHGPARVAHDLNNMLTALLVTADAALERGGLDPETRADLESIREGALRGTVLVRRLGAAPGAKEAPTGEAPTGEGLGGEAPGGKQPILPSVNACLRATLRLLAARPGNPFTLTASLTEPDGPVRADPAELDRTVMNLVINARNALPAGGTVALRTEYRVLTRPARLTPDTVPPGGYVVIAVADTGPGIPRDLLPRIFEAGFTTGEGSGLGLASVRACVARMGGFLAVESREGGGATFAIHLPRLGGEAASAREAPEDDGVPNGASPPAARGTVLLVEDDPLVRLVAERVLRRAGWKVRAAESAEAALAHLDRYGAPDLLVTDVEMPGLDGVALARRARADWPGLPVVLASGYAAAAARDEVGGADVAFLAKPYTRDELRAAVDGLVAGR